MIKKEIDFKDKITIDDLNENQYRVRRNLLIFSTIGVFYKIYSDKYEIKIKQIFGIIEFKDPLNPDILEIGLFFLILYFFIHWTLIVWQHLKFMRIRVTKNPTESNLHYWFSQHFYMLNLTSSEIINSKKIILEELEKKGKLDTLVDKYFEAEESDSKKLENDIYMNY